jgi:HAE1 family hydrophobic/amphiphilic exporter-1
MGVEVDREKASVYGVTIEQVRQELFNAFSTRQVASIYTPTNDYWVILESQPEFQTNVTALSKMYLKTASGVSVPLEAVTRIVPSVGPLQVNHQGNQPSVTISFNLAPGFSLGQAVDAIKEVEREARLPASITTGFQGAAAVFQESLKGQGVLVLAAIFATYVLLGILYESFIHPITIISGLPSAGVGRVDRA